MDTNTEWKYFVSKKNDICVRFDDKSIITLGHIYSDDCGNPKCCNVKEHARAKLIAAAPRLLEALTEISEGKGRYDMDKLRHAANTIEDMIKIAKSAIKLTE